MVDKEVGYKRLIIWQKADEFAFEIYKATKGFPKEETYGIISQIRRASLSVALNIAEGYGRQGRKELKQFINMSLGSLSEVRYLLEFSFKLGYFNQEKFSELEKFGEENGRVLWKFYKSL
ncbi:MAG: four helix bundle protein [Candidatus Omnitrophica bacterium]|nr:four helix bundle protein [Candidatus Omnitrophota bacterium]